LGLAWVDTGDGFQPQPTPGRPIGDYISDPNGNLWPGFKVQDLKCSLGPVSSVANSCPVILKKCIKHDGCYERNKCNASSWAPTLLGGTKPCNKCNTGFFK
jgi:hypothetical protein